MPRRRIIEYEVATSYVADVGMVPHIRVRARSKAPLSWDELQEVKREAGFGDATAIEVYPPDDEIVDEVRMRHLWVMPYDYPVPSLRRR